MTPTIGIDITTEGAALNEATRQAVMQASLKIEAAASAILEAQKTFNAVMAEEWSRVELRMQQYQAALEDSRVLTEAIGKAIEGVEQDFDPLSVSDWAAEWKLTLAEDIEPVEPIYFVIEVPLHSKALDNAPASAELSLVPQPIGLMMR